MSDVNYLVSNEFDRDLVEHFAPVSAKFLKLEDPVQRMLAEQISSYTEKILNDCRFAYVNREQNAHVFSSATFSSCMKSAITELKQYNGELNSKFRPVFCPWIKVQANVYVTCFREANLYKYMWAHYGEKDYTDTAVLITFSQEAFCDLVLSEAALVYMKYGFLNRDLLMYAVLYISFNVFSYTTIPFDKFRELFDAVVDSPESWKKLGNKCGGFESLSKQIVIPPVYKPKSRRPKSLKHQVLELFRTDKEAFLTELSKHPTREQFYSFMKERYDIGARSLRQIASDHGLNRKYRN